MGQKEGRRIKSGHPMDAISPFIMDTRSGSSNQFNYRVNIEKCEELIKRKKGGDIEINGKAYQIKFEKATFASERTLENFEKWGKPHFLFLFN